VRSPALAIAADSGFQAYYLDIGARADRQPTRGFP